MPSGQNATSQISREPGRIREPKSAPAFVAIKKDGERIRWANYPPITGRGPIRGPATRFAFVSPGGTASCARFRSVDKKWAARC
jgi:hypothetical protein